MVFIILFPGSPEDILVDCLVHFPFVEHFINIGKKEDILKDTLLISKDIILTTSFSRVHLIYILRAVDLLKDISIKTKPWKKPAPIHLFIDVSVYLSCLAIYNDFLCKLIIFIYSFVYLSQSLVQQHYN